ncbi:hypothetical protein BJ165DRAFT_1411261 [Panaeolus papilionaceus]|nr:hypothetical protein BJ165DRAFT_1411261 [Panaeolus papilionaceus]
MCSHISLQAAAPSQIESRTHSRYPCPDPSNSDFDSSPYFVVNNRVMEDLELNNLEVTGDISVKPVTKIPGGKVVYIIMGPTGAGKSTFIEALAGGSQNLAISSDQLAGFTQHVTAYKLVNVVRRYTGRVIYLVDTPGFSDDKISEIEVMDMLGDWLEQNWGEYPTNFVLVLQLTRLPGSRRRTIKMLKESLGETTGSVTVTTTMWDTLHSERTRSRAEKTFEQLKDQVFKEFFGRETNLLRFMGTRTSALQVMDIALGDYNPLFDISANSSTHLYCDLHERIEGAFQKKVIIELDLAHSDTQTNKELKAILEQDQKANDEMLAKFISQLVQFGEPPCDFREGAQALRKSIMAKIVPANHKMRDVFQQWTDEPGIRSGPVSDAKLTKTILAMLAKQHIAHQPSWKHNFNEPFRRLLNSTNIHHPNWLKRGE